MSAATLTPQRSFKMNKKLNLLVMLVSLLALSLAIIGCPTDSDDGGGGPYYRLVYQPSDEYGSDILHEIPSTGIPVLDSDDDYVVVAVQYYGFDDNWYTISFDDSVELTLYLDDVMISEEIRSGSLNFAYSGSLMVSFMYAHEVTDGQKLKIEIDASGGLRGDATLEASFNLQ
jgi:hypothetical protein